MDSRRQLPANGPADRPSAGRPSVLRQRVGGIGGIVFVVVLNVFIFGWKSGSCTDDAAESTATSLCAMEPALGTATAWIFLGCSAALLGYLAFRLLRSVRR